MYMYMKKPCMWRVASWSGRAGKLLGVMGLIHENRSLSDPCKNVHTPSVLATKQCFRDLPS